MTRTMSRLALVLVILALAVGCGTAQPRKGDLLVYVAVPLSGSQADGGQTVLGGVRLAVDEINRKGGLLGYRLVVMPLDDQADSDVAVQVANQVADAVHSGKKVLGVVGHYNSGQSAAALPIYKDLPIIVITPTASDPALTAQGYRNFFRVNATDAAQGPFDAAFLVNDLKAQRIAMVFAENDYGQGLKAQMVKALRDLGRDPVEVIDIKEAQSTYAPAVARIKAANPDAVFLAGYETEGYVLLPELREAGIQASFLASDGCFLYDFVDGSGQYAEGAYVSGITPDPKVVASKTWWNSYQQLETRNPGTYSVAGYSAMTVLAEAVRKTNSLEVTAIEQALRSNQMPSLIGTLAYDDKGDLKEQRVYVFQVKNSDFVQVKPAR
jgi:branched-chain amino acid transport system substrate-binding protein